MKVWVLFHVFICVGIFTLSSTLEHYPGLGSDDLIKTAVKQKTVSPCQACNYLVESFLKALEETTRLNFEGGDADWERQKLGTYENSELRFIEVQEKLCSDLKSGIDQCYNLAELHEAELEKWFFEKRRKDNLYTYLCVNHLQVCCPLNTYGPNCIPCPGGVENPCNGNGKCKNGGTRNHPAACLCDAGYSGTLCEQCKKGYYQDLTTANITCRVCDKACKDHCRGPGPNNCEVCSEGYSYVPNEGCIEQEDFESDLSSGNTSIDNDNLDLQLKPDLLNVNTDHQEL